MHANVMVWRDQAGGIPLNQNRARRQAAVWLVFLARCPRRRGHRLDVLEDDLQASSLVDFLDIREMKKVPSLLSFKLQRSIPDIRGCSDMPLFGVRVSCFKRFVESCWACISTKAVLKDLMIANCMDVNVERLDEVENFEDLTTSEVVHCFV